MVRLATSALCLAIGLVVGNNYGESKRPTYANPAYGFRIEAPNFPKPEFGSSLTPVVLQAQAVDGFAPNVSVNVQRAVTTRDDFAALSRRQFESLKFKVNEERNLTVSGADAVLLDYEGSLHGRDLRFLALAVVAPEQVLLVTCTAPTLLFGNYEKEFRASIESFALTTESK